MCRQYETAAVCSRRSQVFLWSPRLGLVAITVELWLNIISFLEAGRKLPTPISQRAAAGKVSLPSVEVLRCAKYFFLAGGGAKHPLLAPLHDHCGYCVCKTSPRSLKGMQTGTILDGLDLDHALIESAWYLTMSFTSCNACRASVPLEAGLLFLWDWLRLVMCSTTGSAFLMCTTLSLRGQHVLMRTRCSHTHDRNFSHVRAKIDNVLIEGHGKIDNLLIVRVDYIF